MVPGKNRPAASAAENHTSMPTLLCAALVMSVSLVCAGILPVSLSVVSHTYPKNISRFRDVLEFLLSVPIRARWQDLRWEFFKKGKKKNPAEDFTRKL
ncbi:hypothetical protein Brsp02_00022 [Brucella sp. NBRC 113783]